MADRIVKLRYEWVLGDLLDGGGFGRVYRATSTEIHDDAVAKLVPKAPGAEREFLFVDLGDARNVVPVLDCGESEDDYVLVMPRAEKSLRAHLAEHGKLSEVDAIAVLSDITAALEDLDGRVVHRDLKPENVLFLDGHWRLADFGISRYAESTTAADTHKYSMTPPYAAPEQWRFERASGATDVYALGVIGYEMLAGARPFAGPDFREQHLQEVPATLQDASRPLAALVAECLQKSPGARPSAGDVARRLATAGGKPKSAGLARLQQAHHDEISQRAAAQGQAAAAETESERRERLFEDGRRSFGVIADALHDAFVEAAPSIVRMASNGALWQLQLGEATLRLTEPTAVPDPTTQIPFDVIATAELSLEGRGSHGYRGRSHSLWYCDAGEEGHYGWYEMAFMESPLTGGGGNVKPFALPPGQAGIAFSPAMGTKQLARSLRRLVPGELDDFIARWGDWLAAAYDGTLTSPSRLPEEDIAKNYRGAR